MSGSPCQSFGRPPRSPPPGGSCRSIKQRATPASHFTRHADTREYRVVSCVVKTRGRIAAGDCLSGQRAGRQPCDVEPTRRQVPVRDMRCYRVGERAITRRPPYANDCWAMSPERRGYSVNPGLFSPTTSCGSAHLNLTGVSAGMASRQACQSSQGLRQNQ